MGGPPSVHLLREYNKPSPPQLASLAESHAPHWVNAEKESSHSVQTSLHHVIIQDSNGRRSASQGHPLFSKRNGNIY